MLTSHLLSLALMPVIAVAAPAETDGQSSPMTTAFHVYIGTGAHHIYLMALDTATGRLSMVGPAVEAQGPGFVALHPVLPVLYAVESIDGGVVSAYRIEPSSGLLTLMNRVPSRGDGPCHVAVSPERGHVAVANYSSGSVALIPIDQEGILGNEAGFSQHEGRSVNPQRQEGPHAHSVTFHPEGGLLLAADLGVDKVFLYRYEREGATLAPNVQPFVDLAAGAGPRHVAFHPSARFVYVVNELGNTVTVFTCGGPTGPLEVIQSISTLPEGFAGENTTAEIRVHPSGRYVYASNRGHDSIAAFAVDASTGRLTSLGQTPCGGKTPRNFNLDPTGRFLLVANQDSNNVAVLAVDLETGIRAKSTAVV